MDLAFKDMDDLGLNKGSSQFLKFVGLPL